METALYGVYTLVVLAQKSHSFTSLTSSISDAPQLVCKHRTRALYMKYSIFIRKICRVGRLVVGDITCTVSVSPNKFRFANQMLPLLVMAINLPFFLCFKFFCSLDYWQKRAA